MARIIIDKKIVKYAVAKADEAPAKPAAEPERTSESNVIRMHEKLERPEVLIGSTYKVKTPVSDHAMYVTINDIVLNEGTPHEQRRPFEIFINSKNLDHYQWIVALTRIMSAVFRKGGDVTFLVDELKAVFDPRGGYWQPGGRFMPSIIAELGHIVEKHLIEIGLLKGPDLSTDQKEFIAQKRADFESRDRQKDAFAKSAFPEGAQLCGKCSTDGRRHARRLHDVPELRLFEMRLRFAANGCRGRRDQSGFEVCTGPPLVRPSSKLGADPFFARHVAAAN